MTENKEPSLQVLDHIQSLRYFLKSDVQINNTEEKEVIIAIKVYNDAPESHDGGNVVFSDVGLRFIFIKDMSVGSAYRPSKIIKSRPSDKEDLRRQYNEGKWVGNTEAFPVVTSDEQDRGDMLFPGESVRYEISVSKDELRYLDIRVEGTVSRRYLLHISRQVDELELFRKPFVVESFRLVDKVDIFLPLIAIANELPSVGPNTTFADIDSIKAQVENGLGHLNKVYTELKETRRSAPSRELQDYIADITKYIESVLMAFDVTQKAHSSGDMQKIKQAVDEMKEKLLGTNEIKRKRAEIIARFDINS